MAKTRRISIHMENRTKSFGIAIIILSFVLAIVIGFIAGKPVQVSTYREEKVFNFELALSTFLSGALSSAVFFAIGAMIDRQNAMIGILIQMYRGSVKGIETVDIIESWPQPDYDDYYLDNNS